MPDIFRLGDTGIETAEEYSVDNSIKKDLQADMLFKGIKEETNYFGQDIGESGIETFVAPAVDTVKNLGVIGETLFNTVTGEEGYSKPLNSLIDYREQQKKMSYGIDPANKNMVNPAYENTLRTAAEYMTPFFATKIVSAGGKAISKSIAKNFGEKAIAAETAVQIKQVAKERLSTYVSALEKQLADDTLSATKRAGLEHELRLASKELAELNKSIDKDLVKENVDFFSEEATAQKIIDKAISKQRYDTLKDTAAIDISGTLATAELATTDPTTGKGKAIEHPLKAFAQELGINLASSMVLGGAYSAYKDIGKAKTLEKAINEGGDILETADIISTKFDDPLLKGIQEKYKNNPKTVIKSENIDDTMHRINDNKIYGVFSVDDGSIIVSIPKLGTMRLYRDKNGGYFMKGEDANTFTKDLLAISGKEADDKFIYVAKDEKGSGYGFNSLQTITSIVDELQGKKGRSNVSAANKELVDDFDSYRIYDEANTIIPGKGAGKRTTFLRDVYNKYLGDSLEAWDYGIHGNNFLNSFISDTKNLVDSTNSFVNDNVSASMFNEIQDAIETTVSSIGAKSAGYNPVAKAMFREVPSAKERFILKDEARDILNHSIKRNIAKLFNELKLSEDGKFLYATEDNIPNLANNIVSDFLESTGLRGSIPDIEGFRKQITNSLEGRLTKKKLFGSNPVVKNIDGGPKKVYIMNKTGSMLGSDVADLKTLKDVANKIYTEDARLNRMMNDNKFTISYDPKSSKVSLGTGDTLAADYNNFLQRLDNDSIPLQAWIEDKEIKLSFDANTYQNMVNTTYYFTKAPKEVETFITNLSSKGDLQKARFLGLITEEQAKLGSLEKAIPDETGRQLILDDVINFNSELDNYLEVISKYDDSKGISFDAMKVITNRIQHTGVINPQQGILSKMIFTTTKDIPANKAISFQADAVRLALDEFDDLLKYVDKNKYGITDVFKNKYFKLDDNEIVDIAKDIYEGIKNDKEFSTDNFTVKELQAYNNIEGVATGNNRILTNEYDAVTSMRGLADAYMKLPSSTGIGKRIVSTAEDMYVTFGTEIFIKSSAFDFLEVNPDKIRKYAKGPAQQAGYGEGPIHTVENYIIDEIISRFKENKSLGRIVDEVEQTAYTLNSDFKDAVEAIEVKIAKFEASEQFQALDDSAIKYINQVKKTATAISGSATAAGKINKKFRGAQRLNSFDNLETLKFKLKSSSIDLVNEIDNLLSFKDTLLINSFINKAKLREQYFHNPKKRLSGNTISLNEVKAVSKLLTSNKANVFRKATRKAFGDDFIALQDATNDTFMRGYKATVDKLTATKLTDEFKRKIFKDLGLTKGEQLDLLTAVDNNHITNLWDFVDLIQLYGKDVLTSQTVYNELEFFTNGLGSKVVFVNNKATSFHEASGMQYTGLSPISNALPFLLHSTDASIAGYATRKVGGSMNMRWDSFKGLNAVDLAKAANEAVGHLTFNNNIFTTYLKTYDNSKAIELYHSYSFEEREAIFRDMARRKIIVDKGTLTAKKIDAVKDDLIKTFDDNNNVQYDILKKLQGSADDRLANMRNTYKDGFEIEHYYNGSDKSLISYKYDNFKYKDYSDVTQRFSFRKTGYDLKYLEDINYDNVVVEVMRPLTMMSINTTKFFMDINEIKHGTKSKYISASNNIVISKTIKDKGFFQEYAHELVHAVSAKIFGETYINKKFGSLMQKFEQEKFEVGYIESNEFRKFVAKESGEPYKEVGMLEQNGYMLMSETKYDGMESSASILDRLVANEMLMANNKLIAKIRNNKNISDEASALVIRDKTGVFHKFYTLDDFSGFLNTIGEQEMAYLVNDMAIHTAGIMNGSPKVKAHIFGIKAEEFKSTLHGRFSDTESMINKRINKTTTYAKNVDKWIMKANIFEMFQLNKQSEALETLLGKKVGFDKEMTILKAETAKKITEDLQAEFGVEYAEAANSFGSAFGMGLNKLLGKTELSSFDELNIDLDDFITNKKFNDKIAFQREVDIISKKAIKRLFNGVETVETKAAAKRIMSMINSLASDTKVVDHNKIFSEVNKIAKRYMKKDELIGFDSKLFVQKIASMKLASKYFTEFNKLKTLAEKHKDVFEYYINMMNKHANKYSLFGENFEPRFVEDGTIAYLTPKEMIGNIPNGEVIGYFKHDDNVEYALISADSQYKYLGDQDSNLIPMNISNFEKGAFVDNGIELNAQSFMKLSGHVDKNIAMQISRNIELNEKVRLTNELGFVQWQMLRDANIILTKDEASRLMKTDPEIKYEKLSENNPLTIGTGTEYYYNSRYRHYMEGTKGLNIREISKSIFANKETAKTFENIIITVAKLTDVLKRVILVARPDSYINSAISSLATYAVHGKSVAKYAKRDFTEAGKMIDTYKVKLNEYTDAYMKDPNSTLTAEKLKVLKADEFHIMLESGIITTLRQGAYAITGLKDVQSFSALKRAGNDRYAEAMRNFTLDETTYVGKHLSQAFDFTELRPKMMLYVNLRRSGVAPKMATQTVLMAYPSYNNLGLIMNVFDQFSPYTKFFTSTPRMIMYAVDQKPAAWAVGAGMAHSIAPLSYMLAPDEDQKALQYWKDQGYIYIPGSGNVGRPLVKSSFSLTDIFGFSMGNPITGTVFDMAFPYEATKSLTKTSTYIPLTSAN